MDFLRSRCGHYIFSSGCQKKNAALNSGRHLYLAGQPSRWALAHILVVFSLFSLIFIWFHAVGKLATCRLLMGMCFAFDVIFRASCIFF